MNEAPNRHAFATWRTVALLAAAVMTAVDAALLQVKRAFFTGGFLAVDHLRSRTEAALFLTLSYLGDLAVVGILAALGFSIAKYFRLRPRAVALLSAGLPLFALVTADVIDYQLLTQLGDAFDLALMYELTGKSTAEMFAVAAAQLPVPVLTIAAGGALLALMVFAVNRHERRRGVPPREYRLRAVALASLAVLVAGLVATTSARLQSAELDNGLRRKPSTKLLGSIVETLSDVDRDGYGIVRLPADAAPFDRRIFPYAVEIAGNGIDEDGVGGDLPADVKPFEEPPAVSTPWQQRPDLVLVVLESFRADAVGARRGDRPVTPTLDAIAARGVRSDAAYSHNGYTAQSRHHLMSGSLASLRGGTSLIDDFKAQGYEVGYFSGQDDSFGGSETSVGAERADTMFDARQAKNERYSTFSTPGSLAVPAASVVTRVRTFLEGRRADRPLLLYVNFHDTHYPYHHRGMPLVFTQAPLPEGAIAPSRRAELLATYLNAASYVDRAVGDVLGDVQRTTGRTPAVIVIGDHGESLFDDSFLGHGYALNDTQTRIPLIAAGIPLAVAAPFGQSDLRDEILRAMSNANPQELPSMHPDRNKRVFQYLGLLDRPRQIGFVGATGRVTFDFRSRQVCFGERCVNEARLDDSQRPQFLDLVRHWEAMVLARAHAVPQD